MDDEFRRKYLGEEDMRLLIDEALREKDPEQARKLVRSLVGLGADLHQLTDLHFPLMLLMACGEKKQQVGRKPDRRAAWKLHQLRMACLLKAEITGQSFSKTWEDHMGRARPKKPDEELWRCSAWLQDMLTREKPAKKGALYALTTFSLTQEDLERFYVRK